MWCRVEPRRGPFECRLVGLCGLESTLVFNERLMDQTCDFWRVLVASQSDRYFAHVHIIAAQFVSCALRLCFQPRGDAQAWMSWSDP